MRQTSGGINGLALFALRQANEKGIPVIGITGYVLHKNPHLANEAKMKFYDTKNNRVFNTVLTAWKYNIEENSDVIRKATFTLGKTRNTMTSVINKRGLK